MPAQESVGEADAHGVDQDVAVVAGVEIGLARHRRHHAAGRARQLGQAVAQRLRHPLYHLNLIAYNETGGAFSRPAPGELEALRLRLERAGVSVTVRRSPGGDIEAACGQLALS